MLTGLSNLQTAEISDYDISATSMSVANDSFHNSNISANHERESEGEAIARLVFGVTFLTVLAVTGTIGNLIVIFSIIHAKLVHRNGNLFIINLAVADLLVAGIVVPVVIANLLKDANAVGEAGCKVVGVIVTISCTCSIYNLVAIAVNRYVCITSSEYYPRVFSNKNEYKMAILIWVWSVTVASPTINDSWGGQKYYSKSRNCAWDSGVDLSYTISITVLVIFIPLLVVGVVYVNLFRNVLDRNKRITKHFLNASASVRMRASRRERRLLQTLVTTVIVFTICWVPFGVDSLIRGTRPDTYDTSEIIKKLVDWIALGNSSVNFLIYGALNHAFRKAYKDLIRYIFCIEETVRRRNSGRSVSETSA